MDPQMMKHPRTPHLPWSPGGTADDLQLHTVEVFEGEKVVVTEKLDGECTTIWSSGRFHARSPAGRYHNPTQWPIRQLAQGIGPHIPRGWRLVGENMFAKHSLMYHALPAWFLVFAVVDETGFCLAWDDTKEWTSLLKKTADVDRLETVPELYVGSWNEDVVRALYTGVSRFGGTQEGYVVRLARGFEYGRFSEYVAKFVRPDHVQTGPDWRRRRVTPNRLAE